MRADQYRNLGFRLDAGDSLAIALRDLGGDFRKASSVIEGGESLADAFRKAGFPAVDRLFGSVGEQAGRLEQAFAALARYYETRNRYSRSLWGTLLRSAVLLLIAFAGGWFLFRYADMRPPLWFKVWLVGAAVVIAVLFSVVMALAPGLTAWVRTSSVQFMTASGMSFEETKRHLREAGLGSRRSAEHYDQLLGLKGEHARLLRTGEETGKLDDALDRLEGLATARMERWLIWLQRSFFYVTVVIVMVTVLAAVFAFATSGFQLLG